jgi:hypothetical protein
MGNGESVPEDDENFDEYTSDKGDYESSVAEDTRAGAETPSAKTIAAKSTMEKSLDKYKSSLEKKLDLSDGTLNKMDFDKDFDKQNPPSEGGPKPEDVTKVKDYVSKLVDNGIDVLSKRARALGIDPDKLFKIDLKTGEVTPETKGIFTKLYEGLEEKLGVKTTRWIMRTLIALGLSASADEIGFALYNQFKSQVGCDPAKAVSGCYAVSPSGKQDKFTPNIVGCNYDNLCGDKTGTSGSGCKNGTPQPTMLKCCIGQHDPECMEGGDTCTAKGKAHSNWSYTIRCDNAGQGVWDFFGQLGKMIEKGIKFIFIAIAVFMGLFIVFMLVKLLLGGLGKKMSESSSNSSDSSGSSSDSSGSK